MTVWPGYFSSHLLNTGAGHPSASEQPASRSGTTTIFVGLRILAVSAMKWTPAKQMTSASVLRAA